MPIALDILQLQIVGTLPPPQNWSLGTMLHIDELNVCKLFVLWYVRLAVRNNILWNKRLHEETPAPSIVQPRVFQVIRV